MLEKVTSMKSDFMKEDNWASHTYINNNNKVLLNRIHYSNGVFRCVEKIYYGGLLCYHYSYIPNTDILEGEIIAYG